MLDLWNVSRLNARVSLSVRKSSSSSTSYWYGDGEVGKYNEKWCTHSRCHRAYLKQTQLIIYARVRMARVESSNFAMICCWWLEYSVVECWLGEVEIHIKGQNWSATNEDRAIIMMFPNSSRHFFDVSWLTLMPVSWQQQQQPSNDDWKVVAKREKTISGRAGEEKYANCAHDGCLRSLKLFHAFSRFKHTGTRAWNLFMWPTKRTIIVHHLSPPLGPGPCARK